jgi:hypothetical protein
VDPTVGGRIIIAAGVLSIIGSALNWRFLIIGLGRLIGANWLKL